MITSINASSNRGRRLRHHHHHNNFENNSLHHAQFHQNSSQISSPKVGSSMGPSKSYLQTRRKSRSFDNLAFLQNSSSNNNFHTHNHHHHKRTSPCFGVSRSPTQEQIVKTHNNVGRAVRSFIGNETKCNPGYANGINFYDGNRQQQRHRQKHNDGTIEQNFQAFSSPHRQLPRIPDLTQNDIEKT